MFTVDSVRVLLPCLPGLGFPGRQQQPVGMAGGKGPYQVPGTLCKFNEARRRCMQPQLGCCCLVPLLALQNQECWGYFGLCFIWHPLPFVLAETQTWLFSAHL